ncbi:MAG: 3-deoxy-8-phosphooctulonate synthase [Bacteroides sp.]
MRYFTGHELLFLAGPCVVENRQITFQTAERLVFLCEKLHLPLVFKASYRKANRSRVDSFTGVGDEEALRILEDVKREFDVPLITDVHDIAEVEMAASVVDILQIPAFLCRQTDLLQAAGRTGKIINIKKGQFLAPDAMRFVVKKIHAVGNEQLLLTERGTMFGYSDLVVDFRGIPTMQATGCPVILDITHSLQEPNQVSGVSGGRPALIEYMARLGVVAGVDGIFFETHPKPSEALSDGANMLPLDRVEGMLTNLKQLKSII